MKFVRILRSGSLVKPNLCSEIVVKFLPTQKHYFWIFCKSYWRIKENVSHGPGDFNSRIFKLLTIKCIFKSLTHIHDENRLHREIGISILVWREFNKLDYCSHQNVCLADLCSKKEWTFTLCVQCWDVS